MPSLHRIAPYADFVREGPRLRRIEGPGAGYDHHMSDAVIVALVTGSLALVAALGAALFQGLSAPRRLERQAGVLKTLGPLAKDPALPSARRAFDNVADLIARKSALLPWWWRIVLGGLTLGLVTLLIVQYQELLAFLKRSDGATQGKTLVPETLDYRLELTQYLVVIGTLAVAAAVTAVQATLRPYRPMPGWPWIGKPTRPSATTQPPAQAPVRSEAGPLD